MNLRVLYAIMVLISSLGLQCRTVLKSISIDYVEEEINGSVFTYRRDMIDGSLKEIWTIDGKKVCQEDYEEGILHGEMEERRKERMKEHEARMMRKEYIESSACALYKKLIRSIFLDLKAQIDKFERYNLFSHLVVNSYTIASNQEFDDLVHEILPELQDLMDHDSKPLQTLKAAYEKYGNYPEKLSQCLYETIQHTIKTVDDTKLLKELLGLISEEP